MTLALFGPWLPHLYTLIIMGLDLYSLSVLIKSFNAKKKARSVYSADEVIRSLTMIPGMR